MNFITKAPIAIYGAGFAGVVTFRCFKSCGITPVCFIDKNKYGTQLEGICVIKPEQLCEFASGATVVVSMYTMGELFAEIKQMLYQLGVKEVVHLFELRQMQDLMKNQPFPLYIDEKFISDNQNSYTKFRELLEDEKSKSTLDDILEFISLNPNKEICSLPIKEQYLPYKDVYSQIDDEIFVDCGAFIGEVFESFYHINNGKYSAYIAFEPEVISYNKLVENTKGYNIQTHNLGLSDRPERLSFENIANANGIISDKKLPKTECRPLDDILTDCHPTFIKIDVEGYEAKVLSGAKCLIKEDMPIIAIAVYHKKQDLWQLPFWINDNFSGYKFYLRSYMNYMETICYAVPKNRLI